MLITSFSDVGIDNTLQKKIISRLTDLEVIRDHFWFDKPNKNANFFHIKTHMFFSQYGVCNQ